MNKILFIIISFWISLLNSQLAFAQTLELVFPCQICLKTVEIYRYNKRVTPSQICSSIPQKTTKSTSCTIYQDGNCVNSDSPPISLSASSFKPPPSSSSSSSSPEKTLKIPSSYSRLSHFIIKHNPFIHLFDRSKIAKITNARVNKIPFESASSSISPTSPSIVSPTSFSNPKQWCESIVTSILSSVQMQNYHQGCSYTYKRIGTKTLFRRRCPPSTFCNCLISSGVNPLSTTKYCPSQYGLNCHNIGYLKPRPLIMAKYPIPDFKQKLYGMTMDDHFNNPPASESSDDDPSKPPAALAKLMMKSKK